MVHGHQNPLVNSTFLTGCVEQCEKALLAAREIYLRSLSVESAALQLSVKSSDESLVTVVDRQMGRMIRERLSAVYPAARFSIEDDTIAPSRQQGFIQDTLAPIFLVDPLDGTRPFSIGAQTSTAIISLVNPANKQIVAAVICELATGRIMSSCGDRPRLSWNGAESFCSVSPQTLSVQSSLFLDYARGFARNAQQVTSASQSSKLLLGLNELGHLSMLGSNGLHHLMVAAGRAGAVGGITMAVGGPWDLGGAFLILKAGGHCKALLFRGGDCVKSDCNPLNPFEYNVLIYGNSSQTVQAIYEKLEAATHKS